MRYPNLESGRLTHAAHYRENVLDIVLEAPNRYDKGMDRKGFAPVLTILLVAFLAIGAGVYYYAARKAAPIPPSPGNIIPTSRSSASSTSLAQLPTRVPLLNATFTNPYPVQWEYRGIQFAIRGLSLDRQKSKITFYLKITNTNSYYTEAACSQFPGNAMRWVPNELGDMMEPSSSKTAGCGLPSNITRNNEEVYFDLSGGSLPYTFTTGGTSNIYFIVHVSPGGKIYIENVANETAG